MDSPQRRRLRAYLEVISRDLDSTVDFWLKHSHDDLYGGFFTCLDENGSVYDETKYGWLQGRQVWMYSKLYNEVERFRRDDILAAIQRGADFLHHLKDPVTWRCYLQVTREGVPVKLQRTVFTECFYLLGLSEASRALKQPRLQEEAEEMMKKIHHWVREDDSAVCGRRLPGAATCSRLAVPLMVLMCLEQLTSVNPTQEEQHAGLLDWAVKQIISHSKEDGSLVLETVAADGSVLPGTEGRLINPGHALECGWVLLRLARRRRDDLLAQRAINEFTLSPLQYGWDKEHGGLLYFLDAQQKPLPVLEWNMKLWWPHNEALIATLMSYEHTRDTQLLDAFDTVFSYAYKHFHTKSGEWYGYLNQQGQVNQNIKGGPFKGCFHLPRSLMMCEQILQRLLQSV